MKAKYLILMSVEMSKISIILIILTVIISLSSSCYYGKQDSADTLAERRDLKISRVTKKSGEYVKFPKDNPGRIIGDTIVGDIVKMRKEIKMNKNDIIIKKLSSVGGYEIIMKNGTKYQCRRYHTVGDTITIYIPVFEHISIPLSEVESVRVPKSKTFLFIEFFLIVLGIFITVAKLATMDWPFNN